MPPYVVKRYLLVHQVADLVEGKAQITKGDEPVEAGQPSDGVQPIPRGGLYSLRAVQPDLVVVAQHPG
jgi:hypothetical protein